MANGEWGDFVWGDGGSPPPFIASALHEESDFNVGLCRGGCNVKHACCGKKVRARRETCKRNCSAKGAQLRAEAEAAVYGNGGSSGSSGGSGNGGGWDAELEADLAEAEKENEQLRLQLAQGGGDGSSGGTSNGNGKMGNTLIIGGVVVLAVILVIIVWMKK